MALVDELQKLQGYRDSNPQLGELSDTQLTDLVHSQTGELPTLKDSSAIGRLLGKADIGLQNLGNKAELAIAPEGSGYGRRVVGRVAANLINQAPELAMNYAAASILPRSKLGFAGIAGLNAAEQYGRTAAETGDRTAALGSAASALTSLGGSVVGSRIGLGKQGQMMSDAGLKPAIGARVGSAIGSYVGGIPGDVLGIATMPGGIKEFLADPVNLPAYLGAQAGAAGIGEAIQHGKVMKAQVEKVKAATPSLDEFAPRTMEQEAIQLDKIPVSQRTEQQQARRVQIETERQELDKKKKQKAYEEQLNFPFAEEKSYSVNREKMKRKYADYSGPFKYVGFQEAPEGHSLYPGFELWNDEFGSTLARPSIDKNMPGTLPPFEPDVEGRDFSLNHEASRNAFIENSLLDQIQRSFQSTMRSAGRSAGPRFQRDQLGMVGGRELKKAIEQWAPKQFLDHYKAAGLDTLLAADKVQPEQVVSWIRENTPSIEVKKLVPDQMSNEGSVAQHKLESLGYRYDEQRREWNDLSGSSDFQTTPELDALFRAHDNGRIGNASDAATGRYGVEPISVDKMDRPVDILVREPQSTKITAFHGSNRNVMGGLKTTAGEGYDRGIISLAYNPNTAVNYGKNLLSVSFDKAKVKVFDPENKTHLEQLKSLIKRPSDVETFFEINEDLPYDLKSYFQDFPFQGHSYEQLEAAKHLIAKLGFDAYETREHGGAGEIHFFDQNKLKDFKKYSDEDRYALTSAGKKDPFLKVEEKEPAKFKGPHFGESDKNVIGFGRGYFHDKETFLLFEVQKDFNGPPEQWNHPLLKSYETIVLKTAIQHALDNGATNIVIPDGKTVSMIEGHDKYAKFTKEFNTNEEAKSALAKYRSLYPDAALGMRDETTIFFDPSYSDKVPEQITREFNAPEPTQLGGMKQHYDRNLPDIMRKLTRDKGELVSLGDMDREASAVFNGKKDITGLKFELSNLSPEVDKMFSVYHAGKQYDYTKQLFKLSDQLEHEIVNSPNVSDEAFIDAVLDGRDVNKAVALNYLKGLAGHKGLLKIFKDKGEILGFADRDGQIAVNVENGQKGWLTVSHELSHVTLREMKESNPAARTDWDNFILSHDGPTWQAILEQLHLAVGLKGQDTQYLSGNSFSPRDPRYKEKVVFERTAALAEILAHNAYENGIKINETVAKYLNWLPMSFQSWLTRMAGQWRKFFGPQTPSLKHYLDDENAAYVTKAFDKLVEFTQKSQAAQAEAYKQLKATGLFDEADFVNKIPTRYETQQWQPAIKRLSAIDDNQARDYSLNWLKESRLVTKTADFWENNFMSALFRTKLIPETLGFFKELHHYRSNIREKELGYLGYLGQDDKNSLSYEQALESAQKKIDSITASPGLLIKMSKVITENNRIREEALHPTKEGQQAVPFVTEDMLVQPQEMVEKYGLSDEQAKLLQRIVKIPALVAEQTLRQMQAADTVNTSKLLYLQNKSQDIQVVKERAAQLTRIASQQGQLTFQRHYLEHLLAQKMKTYGDAADPKEVASFNQQIGQLKQQEAGNKLLFETETRRLFGADIPFAPIVGKDQFIDNLHNLTSRLGEARAEQDFIMKDEGYAPMTRRGRFLLRVFQRGENGTILPKTKEFRGFNDRKALDEYKKKNQLSEDETEVMDKEKFEERAQMYSPKQLQAVRDRARDDLNDFIREYQMKVNDKDPNKKVTLKVLSDIMDQYKPLEREIAEVISVKGDKFRQRRWQVAGFNEVDFIPNIMEYMSYKTASGQKAVTRAEAELQMLQKRVQDDPNLNVRMQRELDYVLNRTNEWSGARKWVFYTYLGASVRHMFQNAMQIPLNGIPEMVHQGAGLHAYSHAIKGSKMLGQYLATGSTGNKTFDVLLKEGEKAGITIPNAVEMVAPETDVIKTALDHASAWANGKTDLGGKVKIEALKFKAVTEKFMRSTAVASEMTNRKLSFIMSLLESERKGVKDPRQMYNSANQFTDYVNFVGDKSNRPGFQIKLGDTWAHAPVLLATAMQSFVMNHLSQLYAYNKLAWKGDKNAKAALATGVFHLIAAGGVMGLPFASNAEQMFESATGISLKTAMREKLINLAGMFDFGEEAGGRFADSVISGFPNFVGVDTGSSLGLGDPMFQWRAGQDTSAMDLAGPAGNVAAKYGRGLSALAADPTDPNQWSAAVRAVAPQALNQGIKIMDAIMDGDYKDSNGNPTVKGLDGRSSLATFTGFAPRQATAMRDLNIMRVKNEKRLGEEYRTAVNLVSDSLADFQMTQNPASLAKAQQQFDGFVKGRAGTQDRNSFVSSISEAMGRKLRGGQKPTSLTEQNSFAEVQKAYPDVKYQVAAALPAAADELKVAQQLGQFDVLATKVKGLRTGALTKALYDSLVQAGIPPATAALIAQHSKSAVQRLSESGQLSSQSPEDGTESL